MVYFHATKKIGRWAAAGTFLVLAAILFGLFPGAFSGSLSGFPAPFCYLLPAFVVAAICCLLLDVSNGPLPVRLVLKVVALLACLFLMLYVIEVLSGGQPFILVRYEYKSFFFGLALLLCILSIAYAATGRLHWALRITAGLLMLYGVINYFTLTFRGTPFIPLDIFSAGTALNVLPNYTFTFTQPLAEAVLVFAGIFLVSFKVKLPDGLLRCQPPDRSKLRPAWLARVGAFGLSVVFLLSTVGTSFITSRFGPDYWDQRITAQTHGSFVNFVANIPDLFTSPPDGYNLQTVQDIAARYTSDSVTDAQVKPDVILVLGESWGDLTPNGYVETNEPVLPFLSSFRNRDDGIYRDLIASTYGGGTSRSEFSILTGANVEYGMQQAPFQFNVREAIPNLTESFKAMGYGTAALHTGDASAWGRDKAFPLLGFDAYYEADDIRTEESRMVRQYLSDEDLYRKTLELLDAADAPQFLYTITIQTHGGFTNPNYQSPITIEDPPGEFPMTEQYLGLMHESDADFAWFISELEKRERPTLVLAYGDHLPLVDDSYTQQVMKPSNPFPDNGAMMDFQTFYVMWANYELPQAVRQLPQYLSLNYLNPYLMVAAGLPLTGYQKFLLEGASEYPVSSIAGFIDSQGNFLPKADAKSLPMYAEQAVMQYNLVEDRDNLVEDFFRLS